MTPAFLKFPFSSALYKINLELQKSPRDLLISLLKKSDKRSIVLRKKGKKKYKYQMISTNGVIISETTFKVKTLENPLTKTPLRQPNKLLEKKEDSFYL